MKDTGAEHDEDDRPGEPKMSPAQLIAARLVMSAFKDAVLGPRLSRSELATRALATMIIADHWRTRGRSVAKLAREIGVSRSTLARAVVHAKTYFADVSRKDEVSSRFPRDSATK